MQILDYIAGFSTLILTFCLILLMLLKSYKTVVDDAVKEARQDAKKQAEYMAERKYREMVESTQYRVKFSMRIVDERNKK